MSISPVPCDAPAPRPERDAGQHGDAASFLLALLAAVDAAAPAPVPPGASLPHAMSAAGAETPDGKPVAVRAGASGPAAADGGASTAAGEVAGAPSTGERGVVVPAALGRVAAGLRAAEGAQAPLGGLASKAPPGARAGQPDVPPATAAAMAGAGDEPGVAGPPPGGVVDGRSSAAPGAPVDAPLVDAAPVATAAAPGGPAPATSGPATTEHRDLRRIDGDALASLAAGAGSPTAEVSGTPGDAASSPAGSTSALVDRIVDAAEQLQHRPPPRRMVVEIGDLRLTVALRGDEVTLAVAGGRATTQLPSEWSRDLGTALSARGFSLGGGDRQGSSDPSSGGQPRDERAQHAPRSSAAGRRRQRAASPAGWRL